MFSKLIVTVAVAVELDKTTELGATAQAECGGFETQPNETVPDNPLIEVAVTVYVAKCPGEMVCDEGETERLKSTTCSDTPLDVLELKLVLP